MTSTAIGYLATGHFAEATFTAGDPDQVRDHAADAGFDLVRAALSPVTETAGTS